MLAAALPALERANLGADFVEALIQPPRGVLDIHMGEYASGSR